MSASIAVAMQHANVRLFHRDNQSGKIFHDQSPLPMTEPILPASAEELSSLPNVEKVADSPLPLCF
jgi:hypothetical protein